MNICTTATGKKVETDVLIIGAGAAGCGAAIAARREGTDVVLLDKGKLDSCGGAGAGNDHFLAVLESGAENDTCEAMVNFFAKPLAGVSADMVINGWFRNMPVILDILNQENVKLVRDENGAYHRTEGFGQPGAWWIHIARGQTLKRKIARRVRAEGVHIFDYILITKLFTQDDHICGCVGYHVLTREFYIFQAKKVVVAMGTSVTRAGYNSTRNPYNCFVSPFNTAGHFVLPYEIGAKLMNMDVLQGATLIPKGFGAPGMNGINSMGGRELNALGERFMGKYDPKWENGIRRNQVLGTYQEIVEGNGPPFFMDMTHFSEEDANHLQNVLMPGDKATYADWTDCAGIEFKRDLLEVEISEIGLGGNIWAGENFETSIPGLFNGCVFFFLSGALCGGYYAGTQAAKAALSSNKVFEIDEDLAAQEKEKIFTPMKIEEGIHYRDFEIAVRNIMDYYMKFKRNEKGMELALKKLSFVGDHASRIKAGNTHELMRAHEAMLLQKACLLTGMACLQRKESGRGLYSRNDYPDINPQFSKPLIFWQEDGQFKFSWGAL